MTSLEPAADLLAKMMEDARVCNKRMVKDHQNAMGHETFKRGQRRKDSMPSRLLAELRRNGGWMTRAELVNGLNTSPANVSAAAGVLVRSGDIERECISNPTGSGRVVKWTAVA